MTQICKTNVRTYDRSSLHAHNKTVVLIKWALVYKQKKKSSQNLISNCYRQVHVRTYQINEHKGSQSERKAKYVFGWL